MKNKLEKTIGPLVGIGSGLAVGGFDVLTSGFPLATGYLLARSVEQLNSVGKELSIVDKKGSLLNFGSYLIGNAIPFGVKYSNEIYNFVEGVLK